MNALSQTQTVLLAPCCEGVYLRWISPLGNEEGWLFRGDVDDKPAVGEATSVGSADGRREVAVRRSVTLPRTVRAGHLTSDQFDALSTILASPAVWQQTPDGTKTAVFVVPGSMTRTSSEGRHVAAFDIQYPRRNALTN